MFSITAACIVAARLRIHHYASHFISVGRIGFLFTLVVWYVCASRRKKEIGGWLLYYYIQLYFGAITIVLLTAIHSVDNFLPKAWINEPDLYPFFLLTTVPGLLLLCAQLVVAEKLRVSRNYIYAPVLGYVLFADLAFALIAMVINDRYFGTDAGALNMISMIWPIIWIPYFYFSKRVRGVFKKRDWLSPTSPEVNG